MNYQNWNDLIASHFFQPEMAGKTVHLCVTEELINDLGQSYNADLGDFITAVKTGPVGVSGKRICEKAFNTMEYWQYQGGRKGEPLYIGYLALFVLAADIEEDFSARAYYPRLRKLLDEEAKSGTYPKFNKMEELWEDLAQWANNDQLGERGFFNSKVDGSWIHVGRPIAQTLLTEKERRKLASFFADAGLDPTAPPSEEAIASLFIKHGHKHKYLRNRTLNLLNETKDKDELRQALLERIIDELRSWDGTAEVSSSSGKQIYGCLRLCCQLDAIAGSATLRMRCSTKHEFPEEDLLLFLDDSKFSCYEQGLGWSSPLKAESDQKILNASEFDWCKGLQMRSADSKWHFRLPASPVRVFIKGDTEGLAGLIEVRQLPIQKPFYLAAHQDCLQFLEKWGESSCQSFEKLPISSGLPNNWYLFKAAQADTDELKHKYPVLSFPTTTVRLELTRGTRVDKGNKFFNFALPKIILHGGDDSIKIYCNDRLLSCTDSAGVYELPTDVSSETKLVIKAVREDNTIKQCFLSLVGNFDIRAETIKQFDRFGYPQKNADHANEGVAGALVAGFSPPEFNFHAFLPIQGRQRILFLGKEPGQVSIWPVEPLPTDWMPIWAISKGRRRSQAMFCGSSLAKSEPVLARCKDSKKLKQWKKILWHDRKKIHPPTQSSLRDLWRKFQKEAGRVKE